MEKCSLTLYPKQQWEIWKPGKPGKLGKPGTADPQLTSTKFLQLRHPSIQQTSSQTHGELWPSSESVSVLHFLHFIILITWHPVDTTSISCFILLVPGFVRASAEFLQHHSSHGASGLSPNAFAQLDWIEDDEDVGCSRERERELSEEALPGQCCHVLLGHIEAATALQSSRDKGPWHVLSPAPVANT